ncbi:MAG: helix-turn-helix transcriptional regulator, partial [Clostridia bacterium]|nr:helix-turn-helix transcriptional regulator [Clostridia bacterium]
MEYTGETPVEYRTRLRLEMAFGMLADGECSVTEAAARSGFNSISFFCREFKKFYGYSAGNISQKS